MSSARVVIGTSSRALDANGEAILDLRKVRDYERRNANRKSVLDAVEAKLASG